MKNNLLLLILLSFTSCNSVKEKLTGGWVVDQAYYYDEPVMWDLYSNGFSLNENNTCNLPILEWADRNTPKEKGTWQGFEENGITYLQIDTENWLFNRKFEIRNIRVEQDTVSFGDLMKMTLIVDSLKMDCTKML